MTARTVIDAAGRPRRLVLRQPPHYRTGVDAPRVQAAAEREAARALRQSDAERNAHYRSNGTRPREC